MANPLSAAAAARAALQQVTCPHCGEVQARARGADLTHARCRRCRRALATKAAPTKR